jgi:ribA/ribD-fused uncharacterized protein
VTVAGEQRRGGLPVWEIPQRVGPWDDPDSHYFYGGDLSSMTSTRGLLLPEGWFGHPNGPALVAVPFVENWFQACKATSASDFFWILDSPDPFKAKRRGGPRGEGGRRIELRPDWEAVKFWVMRCAHGGKHRLPRYQGVLSATGRSVLVEDSPSDFIWGGRDRRGGLCGRNLLGIVLMEVRAELAQQARA